MNKLETKNYIDVTEEWLENVTPNSHVVKEQLYFKHKNKKYLVDNKNVVLDYSQKELKIAWWLENTFGGEIFMLPRINKPDGIKTADYLWNGEYWDYKQINGSGQRTIEDLLKKKEQQAHYFILEKGFTKLSDYEIVKQIKKLFSSDTTSFIRIIIFKNNNHFKAYQKKISRNPTGHDQSRK